MQWPVTASLGVAVHPDMADDAQALLRVADRALYAAKAAGRNRVQLGVRAASSVAPEPADA
jgi:diguanylate cyclase (GGDEF)-like protein